jgi:DNA-binding MarR family transcriptional regulator
MQGPSVPDVAALVDEIAAHEVPGKHGVGAWRTFLRAHATLLRALATDLVQETGLTLGDFDVLAQLAQAGGELRMTELAARVFSSRSNLTRRIDRLVEEGLVRRDSDAADARSVVVALTDAGVARLAETAPVHLRGVANRFVTPLTHEELAELERILTKVTRECTFG